MRLEVDIPEHHYNNIMALDSVNLGRVPYKGIIMYAINALKRGRVLEQEPATKNGLEVDCISRTRAIERLKLNFPISQGADNSRDRHRYMQAQADLQAIKELPSVTPQEPRWIPVSERLPEDGRPVLIYAWNVHHVVARYDSFRTENGYKKCWVTADAWNGNTEIKHDVVAWMPLPEPYKAESENKK